MNRDADAQVLAATGQALDALFALARKLAVQPPGSTEVEQAARALEHKLALARPPFTLQVFADAVLRDRRPLPLPLDSFRRCQQLVSACARWGVQELALDTVPKPAVLSALASALLAATNAARAAPPPQLAGVRLNRLARAHGEACDEASLERMLSLQLGSAIEAAEALAPRDNHTPWAWRAGAQLVWQLERCMLASVTATGRALELLPGAWSPARRSVSAALRAGAVLARLRASPLSQRALMHAVLVLGAFGYAARGGIAAHEAARFARPRWLGSDGELVDPHRLRVCALLHATPHGGQSTLPLSALLHAAYELERRRCPPELDFDLSRLELQAWLASALGNEVDADWGRALLAVFGLIPVGAYVLADGRLGVVAAPNEQSDSMRPRVLVGGEWSTPAERVVLCSPLARE